MHQAPESREHITSHPMYMCPICTTQVQLRPNAELLVLLCGGRGAVEHVVSDDDLEIHRCAISGTEVSPVSEAAAGA